MSDSLNELHGEGSARRTGSKLRYRRYPCNPRLNEDYQTNPSALGSQISGFEISDWGADRKLPNEPNASFLAIFIQVPHRCGRDMPPILRNEPIPEGKGQDERDAQDTGSENYETKPLGRLNE
jgi:hypothetical protein